MRYEQEFSRSTEAEIDARETLPTEGALEAARLAIHALLRQHDRLHWDVRRI